MVLLGDNIYADTLDLAAISSMYAQLQARPAFARLAAAMPVISIYDDHDFAFDNVKGGELPLEHRVRSQEVKRRSAAAGRVLWFVWH
jgi:phosphodiesterase/alkaline phosphatase D-like protein